MTFKRLLTDEQEAELVKEYLGVDDWTINELSVMFKVSKRTVWRILQKHNARRPPLKHHKKTAFKLQRVKPSKVKPKKKRELLPCGTNAAYHRHRKAGEYPCTDCLAAHAENVKLAKQKRKKREQTRSSDLAR
ncbi:MAG: hypothetical protein [Phage AS32]|nr:MAG: hypothetical protein [Phage AS32]